MASLARIRIICPAVKAGPHDPEIIQGNVGELKSSGHISHSPDIRSRRLIAVIYLDAAAGRQFHACRFQI